MQDKVHLTPPIIKIFEGKAPPTSWVEENIVQYYHVQSQTAFLNDLLSYVQTLQSEQMAQARPQIVQPKETFASLPDKGSASAFGNIGTYNAAQGYIKTEIEFLEKLILLLKQDNPKMSQQLDLLLGQLKLAAQAFPKLSPEQLQNLSKMMEQLTTLAKNGTSNSQKIFWNTQLLMLQKLMTDNKGNVQDLQQESNELKGRVGMLSTLEGLLKETQNALKAHPPTSEQLLKVTENLQHLANSYTQLNPEQQQALVSVFQQLGQFKSAKGAKLTHIVADALIQAKMAAFLKAQPNATSAQLLAHLTSFLKESNLQSSPLPFMKSLGDAIEDVLGKKGFPAATGFSEIQFASVEGGKIVQNESAPQELVANYAPHEESVAGLAKASSTLSAAVAEETTGNTDKIEGLKMTINTLKEKQHQFGQAAAWGVGQAVGAGQSLGAAAAPSAAGEPLPSQFANAIINHYMPGQEAYLRDLAMWLFLDNMGAQIGNKLLNDTLGFGQAGSNYNLNGQFIPSNGDFSGNADAWNAKIAGEADKCSGDINRATNASNDITDEINKIKEKLKDPNLSDKQRAMLQNMIDGPGGLQEQLTSLSAAITNLQGLQKYLKSLKAVPTKDNAPGKFDITINGQPAPAGWQTAFGKTEETVISGDVNGKPPGVGGLVSISSVMTTFQQDYANQSQNQQMMLQMRMTEIQQEWTVVSTALQLLNQMYTSIAQAIYK